MTVIALVIIKFVRPEGAVFDVFFKLAGIGLALAVLVTVFSAPTGQWAHAGRTLVVDDIVGISTGELGGAVVIGHAGQTKAGAKVQQNGLERAHITVRLHNRLTDGVSGAVGV